MVPETVGGTRLVEASDELEDAIEIGARVAVHEIPGFADYPHASRIRQMTYCPKMTRCYRPQSGKAALGKQSGCFHRHGSGRKNINELRQGIMNKLHLIAIVTALGFLLNVAPSWGQAPPNPTSSDAWFNTAGGENVLLNNLPHVRGR
jgi:hypothetical protein